MCDLLSHGTDLDRSMLPQMSSVSVEIPNLNLAVYLLCVGRYLMNFVADPSATASTPVAFGSNVPQ